MPRSQYYLFCVNFLLSGHYSFYLLTLQDKIRNPGLKTHLPSVCFNSFPDIHDHPGQFIRPDMRMRIDQYHRISSMIYQNFHSPAYISPFLRTGIEFSIGKSPGSSFPETEIRIRIHQTGFIKLSQIPPTLLHTFSPFQYDRAISPLYQTQSSKQAGRPRPHNNYRFSRRHIPVSRFKNLFSLLQTVDMHPQPKLQYYLTLTGIHRFFQ